VVVVVRRSPALKFVLLVGVMSFFADFTYEGSRSIIGPYLGLLGAGALAIAVITGAGEFLGYGLRLVSGRGADRTGRYWPITIGGYLLQMSVVPLLALARSWQAAALLIIGERVGKAVRNPPRDAILSLAAAEMGYGWGFGVHEALDQFGAMFGPLLVALVLAVSQHDHQDYRWLGRAAIVLLSAGCLVTVAALPLVIRVVAAGLGPVVPTAVTSGALKSPRVQPVFAAFSILSPSWLWVVMPLLALAVLAFALLVSGTRLMRVRRVPTWRSATAGVEGADCYTATGFANPTRRVLATVLHTQAEVRPLAPTGGTGGPAAAPSGPRPGDPGPAGPGPGPADFGAGQAAGTPGRPGPRLGYTSDVIEVVDAYLYRPALRRVMALVRAAKRLQSGRLDAYLACMLIALVALLALVTTLA
jgi:hypothetical protein